MRFPALVLDRQLSDGSSAPPFSSPSSSLMCSAETPAETDGRLDFCLEVLPLRFARDCREDFLERLGESCSGLLFLTAHSVSMILFPGLWRQKAGSNDRFCGIHTYPGVSRCLERTSALFGKAPEISPNDPCRKSQQMRTEIRDKETSSLL